MRFKPKGGIGQVTRPTREAINARKEAIGDKASDDRIFDDRRHETEIHRAENVAFGLPEDAMDSPPLKRDGGRSQEFRQPDLNVPEEVSEESETTRSAPPKPKPKGIMGKARAAVEKVVKKVRSFIQPEPKILKEVIINAEPLETRVAVLEDSRLEDFTVERTVCKKNPFEKSFLISISFGLHFKL